MILNQCLSMFDKSADRDVIWSVPSKLKVDGDYPWIRFEDIEYRNESYKLEKTDCFDGMPLVWAWGLTSVDNEQRTLIRKKSQNGELNSQKSFINSLNIL